ncbi:Uncharacterized protein Fot_11081 [Forsythia ovata]|uniref:Uncharacterized protein n=1 Tax=Forsythia ovata TaxID=205694 RepID=A0ABD1WIQ7_9LAMI
MVVGVIEEARKLPNNKSLFIENLCLMFAEFGILARLSLRTAVLPSVVATSLIGGEFLTDCLLKSFEHRHFFVVEADMKNSDKANAIRLLRFTMSSTKLIFG